MRTRLRPAYTVQELTDIYPAPYDHTRWVDHVARVEATAAFARRISSPPESIADLSCGDGAIPLAIADWARSKLGHPVALVLGDLVGGWSIHGRIEDTVEILPPVDLYVCSETVEHLDDPDAILAEIATKATTLLLTTPLGETNTANPEHYWGWDEQGVGDMLTTTGWEPLASTAWAYTPLPYYTFQFWLARSTRLSADPLA